jgi:hypothetical protein
LAAFGVEAVPTLLHDKQRIECLWGADVIVMTLMKIGKPGMPLLWHAVCDHDAQVRTRALAALRGIGVCQDTEAKQAVPFLLDALSKAEDSERLDVLFGLQMIGDRRAVEPILQLLSKAICDESPAKADPVMVRATSLFFYRVPDSRAVPLLLAAWERGYDRGTIAAVLAKQADPRAVSPIAAECRRWFHEASGTGNWNHRQCLIRTYVDALSTLHDPAAIPTLREMLRSGPVECDKGGKQYIVAESAATAMRKFGFRIEGEPSLTGFRIVTNPGH